MADQSCAADSMMDLPAEALQAARAYILCCECATPIEPNPTNTCVGCLRSRIDLSEDIPKTATLNFCRNCERYLVPPGEWVKAALESRELLELCLKRLKNLQKVKLVDASFLWTEPHSKRIKVQLTVHGTILNAVLEQVFVVEYVVANLMCEDCHRTEAKDFWNASAQVRQKSINRKTFYYLEQLILKHKAHENAVSIKPNADGLDFFFMKESSARKLTDFIISVLPCKYQHSKKLISHDCHSNVYNYKFTFSIELVPLSKDSVICLPKHLTHQLGGITSICLIYTQSFLYPFNSICNPKQLKEYYVINIEPISEKEKKKFPGQGHVSNKYVIADAWVVKDYSEENLIHTRTHLGAILKPGDSKLNQDLVPNVILVRKFYSNSKSARRRARMWKLKHIAEDVDIGTENDDYNDFLEELEEDPEMRNNINIYRDNNKTIPVDTSCIDEGVPQITLEEMLDDLVIEDTEMTSV
ncbi:unnamed protein product [Trichogramma brassicae]|uniref:60S ribosomal export protein NMD3 n=1 Tax=Trichogramma brassicae TaxID=86971 RepID=A0A6H5I368_9HYME|nr:unnamed protein product [Trichogramma brassicae]